MTDTVAKFEHMPLFPPKDGQPWKMEVELEELKNVKKAATEPPQLLLSQAMQDLLPESLGTFHQEKLKAEATPWPSCTMSSWVAIWLLRNEVWLQF